MDQLLVLVDPDSGKEYVNVIIDTFEAGGNKYVLLAPMGEDGEEEENEEVTIFKEIINAQGEEEYVVPTDEEFEEAQKTYEQLCDESDLDEQD